jgi:hypothetical protein
MPPWTTAPSVAYMTGPFHPYGPTSATPCCTNQARSAGQLSNRVRASALAPGASGSVTTRVAVVATVPTTSAPPTRPPSVAADKDPLRKVSQDRILMPIRRR